MADYASLMGIGRGLEAFGASYAARKQREDEVRLRKEAEDNAFNNLLSQMRLTYGLEESPADVALQTLTPELQREYAQGRRTEFVSPSGQRRSFYQPYSRTPEGMKAAEREMARTQTRTALVQAGLSEEEANALADAPPQAVYSALLNRKFPDTQRPTYDPTRGAMIDPGTATARPIEGLPEREPAPQQPQSWYDSTRGAVVRDENGRITVTTPEGLPDRTSTAAVKTTEGQRKAAALLTQAQDALRIIDEVAATGKKAPTFLESAGSRVGFGVGNYLTADDTRRMLSAAVRLADAWLRFTSGAAVPETEVRRYAQGFMPQPGDDEQTLADKANARRLIIDALKKGVGQPGDVDTDEQLMLSPDNPYGRPPL